MEGKPKLSDEPAAKPKRTLRRVDFFIVTAIVGLIVIIFAKTVFLGAPISKVHVIAEWDSIFKNFAVGKSQLMDPSLILLMVPYYMLVGRMWHSGEVPLWNTESGFGAPLLADPQALAFSILHLPMAISPTIGTYNLVLVLELVVLAVGAYALGRVLGLTRLPSAFLAITLACCPFEQWYLELLGNGYCLIPFLLAAFLHTARTLSLGSALLAGVASAVLILSAHPELSFCSITVAGLLLLAGGPKSKFGRSFLLLCAAGAAAFCLAAPMLMPFIEFLVNSDSYKFGNRAPAFYPWQTLAFNLIQPGYGGASPYFGALATLALPLSLVTVFDGIVRSRKTSSETMQDGEPQRANSMFLKSTIVLTSLTVLTWAVSAKVYPLGMLLTKRPFSYLVVTYFFPVLLVLVATLAAIGFERMLSFASRRAEQREIPVARYQHMRYEWLVVLVSLLAIWFFPLVTDWAHISLNVANFDMTLEGMRIDTRDWIRNGVIATSIVCVFMGMTVANLSRKRATLAACLLLVCGFCSEFAIARASLPKRPAFSYPQTETIKEVQSLPDRRLVFTGDHTLRPNTNLVYSIRDIRCHNPIFPKYFLPYLEKAGAKLDEFNQVISNRPSAMLDAASVAYVVTTDAPLEDVESTDSSNQRFKLLTKTSENMFIYENRHAMPDAYIVRETVSASSDEEALSMVASPQFDPSKKAIIQVRAEDAQEYKSERQKAFAGDYSGPARETNERGGGSNVRDAKAGGVGSRVSDVTDIAIVSNRESSIVTVETESATPGHLVVTDVWYPGWVATIDGAPATIARANYSFRAVALPPGKHVVEFNYRPRVFYAGCGLFLAASIFIGIYFAGFFGIKVRRP